LLGRSNVLALRDSRIRAMHLKKRLSPLVILSAPLNGEHLRKYAAAPPGRAPPSHRSGPGEGAPFGQRSKDHRFRGRRMIDGIVPSPWGRGRAPFSMHRSAKLGRGFREAIMLYYGPTTVGSYFTSPKTGPPSARSCISFSEYTSLRYVPH